MKIAVKGGAGGLKLPICDGRMQQKQDIISNWTKAEWIWPIPDNGLMWYEILESGICHIHEAWVQ